MLVYTINSCLSREFLIQESQKYAGWQGVIRVLRSIGGRGRREVSADQSFPTKRVPLPPSFRRVGKGVSRSWTGQGRQVSRCRCLEEGKVVDRRVPPEPYRAGREDALRASRVHLHFLDRKMEDP